MKDAFEISSKINDQPSSKTVKQNQIQLANRVPPILVRINSDNQDKKHICWFWTIITLIFTFCFIFAFFLPESLIQIDNGSSFQGTTLQNCLNPIGFNFNQLYCSPFSSSQPSLGLVIRPASQLNQFALIKLQYTPKPSSFNSIVNVNVNQNSTYLTYTLSQKKLFGSTIGTLLKKQLQDNQTNVLSFSGKSQCTSTSCSDTFTKWIGVLRDIEDDSIFFKIAFTSFGQFSNVSLSTLKLIAQVVNPSFTKFVLILRYFLNYLRYTFLVFSILALFFYVRNFLRIRKEDVIIQQKMVLFASIGLILFNDPFYAITVLKPNIFSNILSTFFVATFIVIIMLLWLIFIDRILYEDGKKQSEVYTWKKWIYVNILHGQIMGFYLAYQFQNTLSLPMVDFSIVKNAKFIALYVVVVVLYFSGLAYIIIQTIRICFILQKIMYRSSLYMFFSLVFMLLMFVVIVTNGISIYNFDASNILFLYVLMNIYVYYLQYMYTPKQNAQIDSLDVSVQLPQHSVLSVNQVQTIIDLNQDISGNVSVYSDSSFINKESHHKIKQKNNDPQKIDKTGKNKVNSKQQHNQYEHCNQLHDGNSVNNFGNHNQNIKQQVQNQIQFNTFQLQD